MHGAEVSFSGIIMSCLSWNGGRARATPLDKNDAVSHAGLHPNSMPEISYDIA